VPVPRVSRLRSVGWLHGARRCEGASASAAPAPAAAAAAPASASATVAAAMCPPGRSCCSARFPEAPAHRAPA